MVKKVQLYESILDLSDFDHPGGNHILPMIENRDSTILFEQYHSNSTRERVQEWTKQPIGSSYRGLQITDSDPEFKQDKYSVSYTRPTDHFWLELGKTVEEFMQQHYSVVQHQRIILTEICIILALCFFGNYLCWTRVGTLWEVLGIVWVGYGMGRIGFLMHHGNHQSGWNSPQGNHFLGIWADGMGISGLLWQMQHNVGHHTDPNTHTWDPDTVIGYPYIRFNYGLPRKPWHKLQFIYIPIMISIGGIKWIIEDVLMFLNYPYPHTRPYGSLNGKLAQVLPFSEQFQFWMGKCGLLFFRGILPYFILGNISVVLRQFFLPIVVASYAMEMIFLVSHNTPENHFTIPTGTHWAVAQVLTTSNWRSGSRLFNFLTGGLNHQIEHHLFPKIPFFYYPQLSSLVKQMCKKYQLPYQDYPSYFSILQSCLRNLYQLGTYDTNPDEKIKLD